MITPEHLALLRCPIDPKRESRLVMEEAKLLCERCLVQYRVREGFPSLLTDEATLPEGCKSLRQLPCQRRD